MRQTLTQLRKILGPVGISLDVDRRRVALVQTSVQVITSSEGEFLEGLDVRDEEFESWLTAERARRNREYCIATPRIPQSAPAPMPAPEGWSMAIEPQSSNPETARWFEILFADSLARSLREVFVAPIYVGPPAATTDWQLVARVQSFVTRPGSVAIRIAIDHPAMCRQVWAGFRDLPSKGVPPVDHPDLQQMVNELIDGLGDYFVSSAGEPLEPDEPNTLFRRAMRSLFSMEPTRVIEADRMLARAMEMERRGLYLAWRMQLRAIQIIEKHPINVGISKEECQQFYAEALDLEPNNSMVLATIANALRQFERDDAHSLFLAERSVRLNPANSFGWWALSAASSYVGDAEGAYRDAQVGRRIAILSPHRFWWDQQVYTSALLSGRNDEALKFAESAHAGNPEFRPPLRYLVALHASEGNMDEAIQAVLKLRRLEPDFTIERLLKDKNYPASLIHAAPHLNLERIASLI